MKIQFYKCNGNGNSFKIILLNDSLKKEFFSSSLIKKICSLNHSVDGLILVNNNNKKIKMDYYNNDGTWETLCLNGLRCTSLILSKKNNSKEVNIYCNEVLYETNILAVIKRMFLFKNFSNSL